MAAATSPGRPRKDQNDRAGVRNEEAWRNELRNRMVAKVPANNGHSPQRNTIAQSGQKNRSGNRHYAQRATSNRKLERIDGTQRR